MNVSTRFVTNDMWLLQGTVAFVNYFMPVSYFFKLFFLLLFGVVVVIRRCLFPFIDYFLCKNTYKVCICDCFLTLLPIFDSINWYQIKFTYFYLLDVWFSHPSIPLIPDCLPRNACGRFTIHWKTVEVFLL